MKKNKLIFGISTALLLSSTLVMAEEEFPAADFQPKILFADESANNKAVKSKVVAKAVTSTATKQEVSTPSENSDADDEGADTDSTMLYGLLALAAASGFLLFKKHVASLPSPNTQASVSHTTNQIFSKDTSGLSGVTRYLKNRELLSASGVERYLAKQEAANMSTAVTGVAKYLKNKG